MVIEPEATLEGIGQIADHISLCNRDLRFVNGERAREEDPLDLQGPCAEGSAHDSVEVIVGDDFFIFQRFPTFPEAKERPPSF